MNISWRRILLSMLVSASLMSLTGCDIISAVKDYFSKPKNKEIVANVAPVHTVEAEEPPAAPALVSAPPSGDVLAKVGGWSLTKNEFNERLKAVKEVAADFDINDPESKRLILDELVRQQLVIMDAEQSGLAKQKDILDAVEEFRRTLIVREAIRKLVENIQVSDDEAKTFYDEQKKNLIRPVQWHVREIVVDTQLQANEALTEVLKGSDFGETAKARSKGKTAANGGDLGFITEEPFPEMADAILALEVGGVSNVFKGPDGFYIVKLEEKKGGEQIPYDEIKDEIIQNRQLFKQQQVIAEYVQKLEEKNKVEINEGLLQ